MGRHTASGRQSWPNAAAVVCALRRTCHLLHPWSSQWHRRLLLLLRLVRLYEAWLLLVLLLQQCMHLQQVAGVAGSGPGLLIRGRHPMLCHDALPLQGGQPSHIRQPKAYAAQPRAHSIAAGAGVYESGASQNQARVSLQASQLSLLWELTGGGCPSTSMLQLVCLCSHPLVVQQLLKCSPAAGQMQDAGVCAQLQTLIAQPTQACIQAPAATCSARHTGVWSEVWARTLFCWQPRPPTPTAWPTAAGVACGDRCTKCMGCLLQHTCRWGRKTSTAADSTRLLAPPPGTVFRWHPAEKLGTNTP